MLNANLAVSGALGGLQKLIQQNIRSTFQTFSSPPENLLDQDTFTRSTPSIED